MKAIGERTQDAPVSFTPLLSFCSIVPAFHPSHWQLNHDSTVPPASSKPTHFSPLGIDLYCTSHYLSKPILNNSSDCTLTTSPDNIFLYLNITNARVCIFFLYIFAPCANVQLVAILGILNTKADFKIMCSILTFYVYYLLSGSKLKCSPKKTYLFGHFSYNDLLLAHCPASTTMLVALKT